MVDKIKKSILKSLVKERRLTPLERLSNRLGYMGTGFFITAPHLLPQSSGMVVYILAGLLSLPQVFVAKQWNLVLVNLNVMMAYLILLSK
jgi:Ni,Fe-hydrogenase I cytochrome b subunit